MSQSLALDRLRAASPAVLPSLLKCDFGNLGDEVARLESAGVPALHLDVMDGNFVPNLTYGMPIVRAIRQLTKLPLDVHLMISQPERYLDQFCEAGADILTIHVEATRTPASVLSRIRGLGLGAGLAFNPATPLTAVEPLLDKCDLVLVMSVPAGFGGQAFHPVALERLNRLRELTAGRALLEVDGGINETTIRQCAEAGADLFVVGSAIFGSERYGPVVQELTRLATVC
jgi:ribulose-phosphate 3-epimerase